MELIIFFAVGIAVFVIVWIAITKAPFPADLAWIRNLLYVALLLVAAVVLWQKFMR